MILAKLAVAVLSAMASAWVLRFDALPRLDYRRFGFALFGIVLPGYLIAAWLLYGPLGQSVPSDVHEHYVPQARAALAGGLVYRDFESAYAPLFSYAGAALLWAWDDPRVYPLAAIGLNALSLWLWLRVMQALELQPSARTAAALYAVSGHALMNVLVGQNQVWLAAGIALALLWALRGRVLASGAALALGLVGVKLLALVLAPAVWMSGRRRSAWLATFAGCAALGYGAFALVGADVLQPLREEAQLPSSGNLPFLLSAVGLDPRGVTGTLSIALGVSLALVVVREARERLRPGDPRCVALAALCLLILMLFSRKSYASYLLLALFPLCHVVVTAPRRAPKLAYLVLCVLAPIEPSLWIRWYNQADLSVLSTWASGDFGVRWRLVAFVGVELALVAAYCVLALEALRAVRAEPAARAAPANA